MIYCLIGPPGAGKTTLAQVMVRYLDAIIISRDPLREMLHGYKPELMTLYFERDDIDKLEKTVTEMQDVLVRKALKMGKDVILDNTHLRLRLINDLKKYDHPIKFIPVETELETAIDRDARRHRVVGADFITKSFEEYEHLKKVFDFKDWAPEEKEPIIVDGRGLPRAFVFDIDGTIALNTSGRSPYDWKRVGNDEPNEPVVTVLESLFESGYDIVLCSGRDSVCRPETEAWLDRHNISYSALYMRPEKDTRKDAIVKEEMWRDIAKKFNIVAMFDDRDQVVEHGRKLGFPVFQVADGDF